MTKTPMPAVKTINGHTYVKVQDLADAWHTTTSHILRTGKPNQVPAQYRKTIDGCTWCDVEGLRYRLNTMKRGGKIPSQLNQFLDRFPIEKNHVDDGVGPQRETIHMKDGATRVLTRSYLRHIDYPSQEEIRGALDNKQVLWRYKNKRIQVLAQTLSSFLDTRTSSLLAVNKKQGVPRKFIHREWKRTWVDLEGLKQRVEHTEHGSVLLKTLKQVIENLDAYKAAYTRPLIVKESQQSASASASKPSASAKSCDVAVEANKRAVHNTERINKLTRDEAALENLIFKYRDACSIDLYTQSKRLDMFADRTHDLDKRVKALEHDVPQLLNQTGHDSDLSKARTSQLTGRVHNLEDRVAVIEAWDKQPKHNTERLNELGCRVHELEGLMYKGIGPDGIDPDFLMKNQLDSIRGRLDRIEAGDKQAVQAMAEGKTPLDALSQRVSSMVTHTDRLDAKTDGLESRVSVLEDTSKWLSWTLAGVIGIRFLGLMLRMLKRK